jgi:hypothetical protein
MDKASQDGDLSQDTASGPGMREWRILIGSFMAALGTTIVNVALVPAAAIPARRA